MIMIKRIISIGLILGLLIAVLSGCSDKMNSDRFVSVLSKNGVSNMVISEPANKETGAKVTYGDPAIVLCSAWDPGGLKRERSNTSRNRGMHLISCLRVRGWKET